MKGLKTQNLNKMKKQFGQCFDVSEKNTQYLKTSIKRSKGKLPEMEVAKAHMKILKKYVKDRSKILDAGCLTGHFYKSFSKHFKTKKIEYYGIDPWDLHIETAKKIWKENSNVYFKKGWIQRIPYKNNCFDVTICCNVLTHVPSIEAPIKELLRVTKKTLLIRTPIHKISYKIQMVLNSDWFKFTKVKPQNEFDSKGNPKAFEYFNVHSKKYFESVIRKNAKNCKINFIEDTFYNKSKINFKKESSKKIQATRVNKEGQQVTDLLIIPNCFVLINKK